MPLDDYIISAFCLIDDLYFHGLLGRLSRKILAYTVAIFFYYQIVKDQFTRLEILIQT